MRTAEDHGAFPPNPLVTGLRRRMGRWSANPRGRRAAELAAVAPRSRPVTVSAGSNYQFVSGGLGSAARPNATRISRRDDNHPPFRPGRRPMSWYRARPEAPRKHAAARRGVPVGFPLRQRWAYHNDDLPYWILDRRSRPASSDHRPNSLSIINEKPACTAGAISARADEFFTYLLLPGRVFRPWLYRGSRRTDPPNDERRSSWSIASVAPGRIGALGAPACSSP